MTQEQYYWFVRRQQVLRAWNAQQAKFVGNAHRSLHFEKPDANNKYLFSFTSDGKYDDNVIAQKFYEGYAYKPAAGRCSSARKGNLHSRNYDWYFDQAPTFILRTPKTEAHLHATLGVATLMHFKASEIQDGWKDGYEFLENAIVDGINDAGLVCNLNVCPPGDNPNYPTKADEQAAIKSGESLLKVWNFTYDTNPGKPKRFVGQICRVLLDNYTSCEEVKAHINDWSWFAARNPESEFQEEFHCMVSDKDATLVIEFVENKVIIHEWKADGTYVGCNDENLKIGQQVQPIMTNFYLSKWDGQLTNLGISKDIPVEQRNATVTEYGMGYERMQVIDEVLKNGSPADAMDAVSYRQIYRADYDKWTSEFLLRTNDPSTDLYYRQDMLDSESYKDFRQRALNLSVKEDRDDLLHEVRPATSKTWQTVHTATYDISNKTLQLKSQQKFAGGKRYQFRTTAYAKLDSRWTWKFDDNCPEDFKQLVLQQWPDPVFEENPTNPPYGTWGHTHVWHEFKVNGYENYVSYGKPDDTTIEFRYCTYINGKIYEDPAHCFFVTLTKSN